MAISISVRVSAPECGEIYGLERITPEVFDRLDRQGNCVVVCPGGDLTRPYFVSWKDKGMDSTTGEVVYKGCVCRLSSLGGCHHYEGVWFTPSTFIRDVAAFIADGGDYISNTYRRRLCAW